PAHFTTRHLQHQRVLGLMFFIVAKSAGPSTQKERHTHITSHHNKKISRLTLNKNIFISKQASMKI
ncbi:hypothetical protein, partial [Sutterella wadsworthensis]|uniref:hypothetical protein n=1 Tax=Sutterella wadsworthensis TaxID=40545 RepID=UPI00307E1684